MKRKPLATPNVTFWGAARTVTGSMHLVEAGAFRILLDCGLFQGRRDEARRRNCTFPFEPMDIDAVVLSHAHIDHCGNLPNLVRQGFDGPIYCTPATADLTKLMLGDSAKIQEEDADHLNHHRPPGVERIRPLYTLHDVHRTARLIHAVPYDRPAALHPDVEVRFVEAGHILGSAMVHLSLAVGDRTHTITFTGDLGRRGQPIIRDPAPVPPADLLICESTYGGQFHPPVDEVADTLAQVVHRTAARGGKLLIPAFSLGRTQSVVYFLHQLIQKGALPPLPIFVDSPLSCDATEVFRLHPDCFDEETFRLFEADPELFGGKRVKYLRTMEESMALNDLKEPCVIIAASGMCEAGRILHHLKHHIQDPRCTVMLAGHQAPDTLGRRLADGQPAVRIFDRRYTVWAEVLALGGISSHADQKDFDDALGPVADQVRTVCLVHGEPDRAALLAAGLGRLGYKDVLIPDRGEYVDLGEAPPG